VCGNSIERLSILCIEVKQLVWRLGNTADSRGENLRRSIWLQFSFCDAVWRADPRMEKQRHFAAAHSRSFHVETLPRQNHPDFARHIGSLDSADGNYLFPALALQFPLFGLALTFWVLLLTYMTNRFAGKIEADVPLALATAKVE
jgi:hypothetical protein